MLDPQTLKHYRLPRDPFVDEFDSATRIYLFESHAIAEAMLWQAALHSGFLALHGPIGSGKTTLLRRAVSEIKERHPHVLFAETPPTSVERMSDAGLMELLILSFSGSDRVPSSRVRRGIYLTNILSELHQHKKICCLVIDEAHRLGLNGFRALKGLYEYAHDAHRLLGIILAGQPMLATHLGNVQIPDVAARCEQVALTGMDDEIGNYLEYKLKTAGVALSDIFASEAMELLARHYNGSAAMPLTINNMASRAMRIACWTGQSKVTEDVVLQALQEG